MKIRACEQLAENHVMLLIPDRPTTSQIRSHSHSRSHTYLFRVHTHRVRSIHHSLYSLLHFIFGSRISNKTTGTQWTVYAGHTKHHYLLAMGRFTIFTIE